MVCQLETDAAICQEACYSTANTSQIHHHHPNCYLLDAIASPSTYPCQSVGEWVIDTFRLEIAIASPSFASFLFSDHHKFHMFLIDNRGICHENLWVDIHFKGGGDVEV